MSAVRKTTFINSDLQLKSFTDSSDQQQAPTLTFTNAENQPTTTIKGNIDNGTNQLLISSNVVLPEDRTKLQINGSNGGIDITGDFGSIDLSTANSANIKLNEANGSIQFVKNGGGSQSITGVMDSRSGESITPRGVKFSADAQFTIQHENNPVNIRISDLYDPNANLAYITNALSAVCRVLKLQNSSETIDGDISWINYFANLNNEKDDQQIPHNNKPPVPQ